MITNEEAKDKIEAMLECMCRSFSGKDEDCNRDMCEACNLYYAQGTFTNHQASLVDWLTEA